MPANNDHDLQNRNGNAPWYRSDIGTSPSCRPLCNVKAVIGVLFINMRPKGCAMPEIALSTENQGM